MKDKILTMSMMKKVMKKHGIEIVYYVDRLHFYTDTRTHKNNLINILESNKKNKINFKSLSKHDHLDKKVELFQPDKNTLLSLSNEDVVSGDYVINYIEFAVDFLIKKKKGRAQLVKFFDKCLVQERDLRNNSEGSEFHFKIFGECKGEQCCKDTDNDSQESYCTCRTRYYTPRSSKVRMAVYSDKPTKTKSKKRCVHIEKRITGLDAVKKFNVYTFQNIIDFNHDEFWSKQLDLRKPNYTALGRLSLFNKKKSGRDADSKRGNKVWGKVKNLQETLRNGSHLKLAVKKIDTQKKLEAEFEKYF